MYFIVSCCNLCVIVLSLAIINRNAMRLITAKQAIALIGCSRTTFFKYVNLGYLTRYKAEGLNSRYDESEVLSIHVRIYEREDDI
jgi:predicted DNA-binding transcriptional regulator AlpA